MPVVWMFQHPTHSKMAWREFSEGDSRRLELAYQSYVQSGTPELMELEVKKMWWSWFPSSLP